MNTKRTNQFRLGNKLREQGSARTGLLMLVSFFVGAGAMALWFHRPAANPETAVAQNSVSPAAGQPGAPASMASSPDASAPTASETAGSSASAPGGSSDSATPAPIPQRPPAPPSANPQPVDPAVIAEVKKQIPNYDSLSLPEGENALRAAALKETAAAAAAMESQVKAAQQQVEDAQNSQSAADQQAAMKNIQDLQAAGEEKFKDIAARLQAEITALTSLKSQP